MQECQEWISIRMQEETVRQFGIPITAVYSLPWGMPPRRGQSNLFYSAAFITVIYVGLSRRRSLREWTFLRVRINRPGERSVVCVLYGSPFPSFLSSLAVTRSSRTINNGSLAFHERLTRKNY